MDTVKDRPANPKVPRGREIQTSDSEKRAALLAQRIITGLKEFNEAERLKILTQIYSAYCTFCGATSCNCGAIR